MYTIDSETYCHENCNDENILKLSSDLDESIATVKEEEAVMSDTNKRNCWKRNDCNSSYFYSMES